MRSFREWLALDICTVTISAQAWQRLVNSDFGTVDGDVFGNRARASINSYVPPAVLVRAQLHPDCVRAIYRWTSEYHDLPRLRSTCERALDSVASHPWMHGQALHRLDPETVSERPAWFDGYFLRPWRQDGELRPVILTPKVEQGATGKVIKFNIEEVDGWQI